MSESVTLRKIGSIELRLTAEPEYELDLSWDEDGSTLAGLKSGEYIAFSAHVECIHTCPGCGQKTAIGDDWLGGCVYESLEDFANGAKPDLPGVRRSCYARDMIKEAIHDARRNHYE